jgi:putative DNA primase/helicase
LKETLADEMSGIIKLALDAFGGALDRGRFTVPKSCFEAKQTWRVEADQAAQFVTEMCDSAPDSRTESAVLFRAYKSWATSEGIQRQLNRKNFTNRIKRLGGEAFKSTGGKRFIAGLKLKDCE